MSKSYTQQAEEILEEVRKFIQDGDAAAVLITVKKGKDGKTALFASEGLSIEDLALTLGSGAKLCGKYMQSNFARGADKTPANATIH